MPIVTLSSATPAARKKLRALERSLDSTAGRTARTLKPASRDTARTVGLRCSSDLEPGFRRVKKGNTFRFTDSKGTVVKDRATLARIRALVLPPAWRDVWICAHSNGHVQATGIDARGRKQYRYHPLWRAARDLTKYHNMILFGASLPRIRVRVARDLASPGLSKQKVLALIVRLMDETHIRIGNDEYAKENGSYGLTTMRDGHATVTGATVKFHFRGKSGKVHDLEVTDKRMATLVKQCRDLPGQDLFQYVDDFGQRHDIKSDDVNAYLQAVTGEQFTAKDFRTWAGTVHAALTLEGFPPCKSAREAKKNVVCAIKEVSSQLGNTPAVCRKCYIHPFILDSYLNMTLPVLWKKQQKHAKSRQGLTFGEAAVLCLLKECFEKK